MKRRSYFTLIQHYTRGLYYKIIYNLPFEVNLKIKITFLQTGFCCMHSWMTRCKKSAVRFNVVNQEGFNPFDFLTDISRCKGEELDRLLVVHFWQRNALTNTKGFLWVFLVQKLQNFSIGKIFEWTLHALESEWWRMSHAFKQLTVSQIINIFFTKF